MVTKVYCDHCGHPAPNAQKYIFGAKSYFFGLTDPSHQASTGYIPSQAQQIAQIQNQSQAYNRPTSTTIVRVEDVDLCDHCQIIWMNRVKALTQASEP